MAKLSVNTIITDATVEQLINRVKVCSKIRIVESDVETTVKTLLKYVDYFNTLGAYDTRALNRDLEDVEIINEIAPFIIPRSVRLSISDINSTDLLVRPSVEDIDKVVLSYDDFMNAQIKFRGYFKKDVKSDFKKLSSLKVDESLANVLSRMAVECDGQVKVRYISDAYVPVLLHENTGFFYRSQYFNATATEVLKDYLAPIVF